MARPVVNREFQHYVPIMLLKDFTDGQKHRIHVFDKLDEKQFKAALNRVAGERDFYNFRINGQRVSLEHDLSRVEGLVAPIFEKIRKCESIRFLPSDAKLKIARFVVFQMLRTKGLRNQLEEINQAMISLITNAGGDPGNTAGFNMLGSDEIRRVSAQMVVESDDLLRHLLDKSWILLKSPKECFFQISDCPVTKNNYFGSNKPGRLGLKSTGIEIYLPISYRLTLAFLCRDTFANAMLGSSEKAVVSVYRSFIMGTPHLLSIPETIFQNGLQVGNASRYIYSIDGNFANVRDMLTADPQLKHPPTYSIVPGIDAKQSHEVK